MGLGSLGGTRTTTLGRLHVQATGHFTIDVTLKTHSPEAPLLFENSRSRRDESETLKRRSKADFNAGDIEGVL